MIRSSGWTRAVIGSVSEDRLKLEYPFELRSEDRFVNRWSVEIAPHKSKTEEAFEFKSKIEIDQQIDAFDDAFKWLKATVVNIKKHNDNGREFFMCTIGMRIYVKEGGRNEDAKGRYDGWGDRFDEQIPLFSPKLAPFLSRSGKNQETEDEIDDSLDEVMQPDNGHSRVWAVPRPRKCTSREYMRHVALFCHQGGL